MQPSWQRQLVVVLLALLAYAPSIKNEYALDDGIVIHQNNFVLKGIRGIGDIITHDLYHSFYRRMNATDQLQGGRYRPLPVISYALEQQIIQPYRTGYYLFTEDINRNNMLDAGRVTPSKNTESEYEFNAFVDKNHDGVAQPEECYACWDRNRNFSNDPNEDINADGVFNEIDCQVYGAGLRHAVNILLYALCCLLLYRFVGRYIVPSQPGVAFVFALLFAAHPVHSEVVANIKGRDDLLSLSFIAIAFSSSFRYAATRTIISLVACGAALLLALLSKEYAVSMLGLVPLALFIFLPRETISFRGIGPSVMVFVLYALILLLCDHGSHFLSLRQGTFFTIAWLAYVAMTVTLFRKDFRSRTPGALMNVLFMASILYLCLRLNAVTMAPGVPDTEILNNPFLLASGEEAFATKVYNLLLYLRIFLFPHPLISDYSYASIPYRHFADPAFILSAVINAALIVATVILCLRRRLLGFALALYFGFLLPVGNFFFFTGTMILESYLFHAGVGLCLAAAWLLVRGAERLASRPRLAQGLTITIMATLLTLYLVKDWKRAKDWENDVTLFFEDVKHAPNSVLVLGNAGARWIDLADTREITGIAEPGSDTTRYNDYNGQLKITDAEVRAGGYSGKREAALRRGISYLEHAVKLHPRYVNGFLNLGLAWFKLNDDFKAIYNWKYAESLYPNNPYLRNYYQVYENILKQRGGEAFDEGHYAESVRQYRMATIVKPLDAEAWYLLGGANFNLGRAAEAEACWQRAYFLEPDNVRYRHMIGREGSPVPAIPPSAPNKERC